jgi:hypothetical protein
MADFVSGWLSDAGLSDGKWYTLEEIADRVGMLGDSNIHIDPRNRLFMFNSTAQMMYIKLLSGTLYSYSASDPRLGQVGYVSFSLSDGTKVIGKEADDGITVSGLGKIHTFVSYDNISGFFHEGTTRQSILDLITGITY